MHRKEVRHFSKSHIAYNYVVEDMEYVKKIYKLESKNSGRHHGPVVLLFTLEDEFIFVYMSLLNPLGFSLSIASLCGFPPPCPLNLGQAI